MVYRHSIEISHKGLGKHRVISGTDPDLVKRKAAAQAAEWNAAYARLSEKNRIRQASTDAAERAAEDTRAALAAFSDLGSLLKTSLTKNHQANWESLKRSLNYLEDPPSPPPLEYEPREPRSIDDAFKPNFGFLDTLLASRSAKKKAQAAEAFKAAHDAWDEQLKRVRAENLERLRIFDERTAIYSSSKKEFEEEIQKQHIEVDAQITKYMNGDSAAVYEYCEMVLAQSEYPEYFPKEWEIEYESDAKTLVVEYELPDQAQLPTLKEVKYVKARDEIKETRISMAAANDLFDSVVYQVCLRTLHELFSADLAGALNAVVFNGYVSSIDRATGQEIRPCIVTVHVSKGEFLKINLSQIEPRVCFRSLKGIGSTKLHSMSAVAPILQLNRFDGRFVPSHPVVDGLDASANLAAMDWEEFEHLIREVFEAEFKSNGGEVKVTQASRDGGVDAVAFDPDPIRGGKIIIQAKRYTNTVGVSAVRDLYGTLMNEGANKGILVTTSDFGPDAFEFAKGKPITLMNGGNLLYLLGKHGHKAKIDIKEAKISLARDLPH